MERNIIIKKNTSAQTVKKEVTEQSDLRDDEVLTEAFGINPYRDLLSPHRILVEGCSDKLILDKAFTIKNLQYGITNGIGSNIVSNATKYNHDDFKIHVIVDDDKEGREYRDKILLIGGVFDKNNVHTIRDLVGSMSNEGTIEDLLNKKFIESRYKEFYKDEFEEECNLELEDSPFIEQIKVHLKKEKKLANRELKNILNKFKKKISEDLKLAKSSFKKNFPLLHELVEKISKQ